jgi:type VI secretion system FHA domain protein
MVLTLEITGSQAKAGMVRSKQFRSTGGTIGRQPSNDFVLPDPYVSGKHARIRYDKGIFYIEDNGSSNGVRVNAADNRLKSGEAYAIKDGDLILIDPFEIRASITQDIQERAPVRDPFEIPSGTVQAAPLDVAPEPEPFDPGDLFPGQKKEPKKQAPPNDWRPISPEHEHFKPPLVEPVTPASNNQIPDDWDRKERDIFVTPAIQRPIPPVAPPVAPRPVVAPVAASEATLRQALKGAGIEVEGLAITPELAENFGQILRVVVEGVMELLQARQQIKDEFRLKATTFKKGDNNPLKFSANLEDALHNLLVKRNAAFLGPVDAFKDAFVDLRFHQMAMLKGVRDAFDGLLEQFDPNQLQKDFDRQAKKGALLQAQVKLRYWDLYCEKVRDMVSDADADESFRELFGDAFAKAYEKELASLKSQARAGKG